MNLRLVQAQAQAINKWHDKNRITFDIVDDMGRKTECEWIDPYIGTFKMKGTQGYCLVKDYQDQNPLIDNIQEIWVEEGRGEENE